MGILPEIPFKMIQSLDIGFCETQTYKGELGLYLGYNELFHFFWNSKGNMFRGAKILEWKKFWAKILVYLTTTLISSLQHFTGSQWSQKSPWSFISITERPWDIIEPVQPNWNHIGTIHLRRQHVLGGEGYLLVPMVQRSQYIRIKNPLHKHFAGMPMVGG